MSRNTQLSYALAVLLLALPLAGCSDAAGPATAPAAQPTSFAESTADAELAALVRRLVALHDEAAAAGGRITPLIQLQQERLAEDVRAWQARTGRDDIGLTSQSKSGPCTAARAASAASVARADGSFHVALDDTDLPQCGCASSTWDPETLEICFLDSYRCSTFGPRVCRYVCYTLRGGALGSVLLPSTGGDGGGVLARP